MEMTATYLILEYIDKTGYGIDMWSKEEASILDTVAEIMIEAGSINQIKTGLPRMQNKPKPPEIKKENNCNDCFYCERGICWNYKKK